MTEINFSVDVAEDEDAVRRRINSAAKRPEELVQMFTQDRSIKASVTREGIGWALRVDGAQFVASGGVEVLHNDPGSTIAVRLKVKPRGIFVLATPAISLASAKIRDEATAALQAEFGAP